MKAVVNDEYGEPDVLVLTELEPPVLRPDEVRVRVRAVEVTKGDCELRRFRFPVKWFWLPLRLAMGIVKPRKRVLGCYFAGEIDAVGQEVTSFAPGERVFGCTKFRMGAYAELVCLPESYPLVAMPAGLDFAAAAAVPLGGLNALHFLNRADIGRGAEVLIVGAGGSIGLFALQMAKRRGARVTVVDEASKEELLLSVGADRFVDYRLSEVPPRGQRFDVTLSTVAASDYRAHVAALNPGGFYLIVNPRLSDMARAVGTSLFTDRTAVFEFAAESREELTTLRDMLEADEIRPVLDRVLPIERIVEAHVRVETERRLGAVVVAIGSGDAG